MSTAPFLRWVGWGGVGWGGVGKKKMEKVGGLGGGLLRVACSGFYVHLKSVFPLIRF